MIYLVIWTGTIFCPNSSTALRKIMDMEAIKSFDAILIEEGQYIRDLLPFIHQINPYTLMYSHDLKPMMQRSLIY